MVISEAQRRRLAEVVPPDVGRVIRGAEPVLRERLLASALSSSRQVGRGVTGAPGRGIADGVSVAVSEVLALVEDHGHDLTLARETFRRLGAEEYRDGRSMDALRSTLMAGGQAVWQTLVDLGGQGLLRPDQLYRLAEVLFALVDGLAAAAAEGYLEEQQLTSVDAGTARRRLVALLLDRAAPEAELQRAARTVGWRLPEQAQVLVADGTDADLLARRVGAVAGTAALGGPVRHATVVVLPGELRPAALAGVRQVLAERALPAALGPALPPDRLALSFRVAERGLRLVREGLLPDLRPVLCAEHLPVLLQGWEPGLADLHADLVLAPFDGLGAGQRRVLETTLLEWLRQQGRVVPTAAGLAAHPQTVRYRMRQLTALLGPALDDPEARHALELALRRRYPR